MQGISKHPGGIVDEHVDGWRIFYTHTILLVVPRNQGDREGRHQGDRKGRHQGDREGHHQGDRKGRPYYTPKVQANLASKRACTHLVPNRDEKKRIFLLRISEIKKLLADFVKNGEVFVH